MSLFVPLDSDSDLAWRASAFGWRRLALMNQLLTCDMGNAVSVCSGRRGDGTKLKLVRMFNDTMCMKL